MNQDKFFKFVDWRVKQIVSILTSKGEHYSKAENKLHNFDRAAQIAGISRERALDGFMLKHYTSYRDILDNMDKGILPSKLLLSEKCSDLINYVILFEASVREKIEEEEVNDRRERENKEILTN